MMTRLILLLILLLLLVTAPVFAGSLPQGYAVSAGTTLWNAGGSGGNHGLSSVSSASDSTASCGSPSTVTRSQIDQSALPGTTDAPIPGNASLVRVSMTGGASGGLCIIALDVANFVPGTTLLGQWIFFQPGFNNQSNPVELQMINAAASNRLVMNVNITTPYVRREEGWNLIQGYCDASLTSPDWYVQVGTPTCASIVDYVRVVVTLAANASVTMYLGDIVKGYYAKPQIVVWGADGDNSGYTELFTYMNARGLKGSYVPTTGEINQGSNPMPLANLLAMAEAGWSIHPHQSTSAVGNYSLLSASALASELALVKSQFSSQGIPMSRFYVPPGSGCTLTIVQAFVTAGFSGLGCSGNGGLENYSRPVYGGYYSWNQRQFITAESNTFSQNRSAIEHAIKYGGTADLLWHKVDGSVTCNVACFKQVIDYLYVRKQAGVLDVVTWDELVSRQTSPRGRRP